MQAKKFSLCLYSGLPSSFVVPSAKMHPGMEEEEEEEELDADDGAAR